jgi:hypothetical protein
VIPHSTMACKAVAKNGPPLRNYAADAHGCIMVRIELDPPYTRLPRAAAGPRRVPL